MAWDTATVLQLVLTFCWEECRAGQDQSTLLALPPAWTNAGYFGDTSSTGKAFPEYMPAPAKPCLGHFWDSIVLGTEGFFTENPWFLRKLLRKPCHNLYSMFKYHPTAELTPLLGTYHSDFTKPGNFRPPSWLLNKLIHLELPAISSTTVTYFVSL